MKIKLLNGTRCPERKRESDCGWDVYLNKPVIIKPRETACIDTGVCIEIPDGYAGLFAIRSSIAKKGQIVLQNPLIDKGYVGELHLLLTNISDEVVTFQEDERIASLFCFPYLTENLEIVDELSKTDRGTAWNGSSGK